MNRARKAFILKLLKQHNIMSFATMRPDGFPQATTVAYANDGLDLYFCCDRTSQKVRNLRRSGKVSLTIDRDYKDWSSIKGLSMGARAELLSKPTDATHAFELLARKFPEMRKTSEEDLASSTFVKVTPKVISVLDYSKGFGHTDLVKPSR
jgi:nitroimidazol reductase NimA-like FMN-containing flavoprotein (pyridoxamine 5'-phosphate oxidase superfamily)